MKFDLKDCVQRGHHYAIVDEVDSILIDEARTPLIISGPVESSQQKNYIAMRPLAERLRTIRQMSQYMREAIQKIGQNGDFFRGTVGEAAAREARRSKNPQYLDLLVKNGKTRRRINQFEENVIVQQTALPVRR